MRIAHISDLHVARAPVLGEYNAKRFLGYLNYRLVRARRYRESVAAEAIAGLVASSPDLVLLTGDITQHGLDSEFDRAGELLAPLAAAGIPVIAVAGNHDIYGHADRPRLESLLENLALGLEADEWGIVRFPGVEILPLFQGIPTPPFFSHGRQNLDELDRAGEAWAEPPGGVMRLVCGHYPVIDPHGGRLVYFHGLREAQSLIDFCAKHRVSGYFCGHNHKRFAAPMPGGCMQYAAPALSAVRGVGKEWVSIYECGPRFAHPLSGRFRSGGNKV